MALTAKQLAERQHYLGGSDVATALGYNQYKTPLELYFEKITGEIKKIDKPQIEYGNDREPELREKFAKITGLRVREINKTKFHPKYKFLAANIDGLVCGDSANKNKNNKKNNNNQAESPLAILEIKTVGFRARKNWGIPVPIPELNMDEKYQRAANEYGFDEAPGYIQKTYLFQAVLYAAIYEVSIVYFAVSFGNDQYLCIYKYERDIELEKIIIDQLVYFWTEYVEKEIPPDPKNLNDIKVLHPKAEAKTQIIATPEVEDVFFKAKNLKNQIDNLTSKLTALEVEMAKYMGDYDRLFDSCGEKLSRFNNVKARGNFDKKRLHKEYPNIYNKFWTPGDPEKNTRTFKAYYK